jgi:hypothetical protein
LINLKRATETQDGEQLVRFARTKPMVVCTGRSAERRPMVAHVVADDSALIFVNSRVWN